jgi:hypothetical protein
LHILDRAPLLFGARCCLNKRRVHLIGTGHWKKPLQGLLNLARAGESSASVGSPKQKRRKQLQPPLHLLPAAQAAGIVPRVAAV